MSNQNRTNDLMSITSPSMGKIGLNNQCNYLNQLEKKSLPRRFKEFTSLVFREILSPKPLHNLLFFQLCSARDYFFF